MRRALGAGPTGAPPEAGRFAGRLPRSSFLSSARARKVANFVLFLGPAIVLIFFFFILPVIVDIGIAFTDMGRTLQVTKLTAVNFERMFTRDTRLAKTLALTFIYVLGTLSVFNVSFGLILALMTTAVPDRAGGFFRAIWLLPRMSPSVVYALLWLWVIDPTESGLLNQIVHGAFGFPLVDLKNQAPMFLIILANGFIGASMGMVIFTSAIRSIPEHLFYSARTDGAGGFSIVWHITLPAIRWPLCFITVYQALSLLVSFEYIWLITDGGPFFDTTVYALYVYKRAFESGQYAYGAALALLLVIIGMIAALMMWRFFDMRRLLQEPRIEVH